MTSSLELVTAMLGVLKAGGAYVLLDSSYPPQQLSLMVKNAGLGLLLAQQRSLIALPGDAVETMYLSEEWPAIASELHNAPLSPARPANVAYLSYTSGSTGPAKAVVISHQAICNYLQWMQENFPLGQSDRVLQLTPLTSHAAAWEFFGPLQGGAQLLLTDGQRVADVENLKEEIGRLRVTTLQLTPTLIRRLLEKQALGRSLLGRVLDKGDKKWARSLKYVFNNGGLLSNRLAADLAERIPCEVHNLYGAAEVASNASAGRYELGNGAAAAIGRPIANVEMYVLDEQLQPAPIGLSGQLYIGGAALARGYLMQPDLTAEKFIPHPFSSQPGARLYQTGDLALIRPDGNIEFLGKREGQRRVKRLWIELGVIEASLLDQAGVSEAVVVTRAEGGKDARLVAYVVLDQETPPKVGELRRELKLRLPEYMVPAHFVILDAMPLLPGGKVDRLALPAPQDLRKTRPGDARWIDHDAADGSNLYTEERVNLQRETLESRKSDLSAAKRALLEQRLRRKDPAKVAAQDPSASARARKAPSSSLVRIQPKGSKRPLFCVHEIGGICLGYADLARHLGSKQPVYGLQSKGLQQDEAVETELQAMATHYVEVMRAVQPRGPYFIVGWSMGGVVAFEMSRQILIQGDSIDLLAVIDTPTPRLLRKNNLPTDDLGFLLELIGAFNVSAERLSIIGEELRRLEPDEQLRFVLNMAVKAGRVERSITLSQFKKFLGVYKANRIALHNYEAQPYDVKVVLFKGEGSGAKWKHPSLGWDELASGGVEERIIPGNHRTLMLEPNVGKLAAELQALMK
jgi:amino acid adenylation domain-containing protein